MSFAILDVAIGLIFTFLTLSLMASVCQELIAQTFQLRGRTLWAFLAKLLGGARSELSEALKTHPRIATLAPGNSLPDAIPAATFAKALAELMEDPDKKAIALKGPLGPFLQPYLDDLDRFQEEMVQWYDTAMTGVSDWYKSRARLILFAIGLALAAILNVSTLAVGQALWINKDLRDIVSAQAEAYVKDNPDGSQSGPVNMKTIGELRQNLETLNLPIGWEDQDLRSFWSDYNWLKLAVGWLLTALAVSLGSQFWYDSLQKLLALRSGLGKSKTTASDSETREPNKTETRT